MDTPNQKRSLSCPDAPKKKRCFKSRISRWKNDRALNFDVENYFDQEEEFFIITQKLSGQHTNSIIFSPDKADLLIANVTGYLLEWKRKKFKNEMQNVFFKIMREKVFQVRREMCEGCLEDYPSQLHHYCLTTETKQFVEDAFSNLLKVVDEEEANEICNKTLQMNGEIKYSKQELLVDEQWVRNLKQSILEYLNC